MSPVAISLSFAALVLTACDLDESASEPRGVTISGEIAKAESLQLPTRSELYVVRTPEGMTFESLACAPSIDWDAAADVHWRQIRTVDDPAETFPMTYFSHAETKVARVQVHAVLTPDGEEHQDRILNRRPPIIAGTMFGLSSVVEFEACAPTTTSTSPCYRGNVSGVDFTIEQVFQGCQ